MSTKFKIDIRNLSEVIKIDKENKVVTVTNHKTGESYEETYDVLVLSPGAQPIKPGISGINECNNLFTLRNIPDTDQIKSFVDNQNLNMLLSLVEDLLVWRWPKICMKEGLKLHWLKQVVKSWLH